MSVKAQRTVFITALGLALVWNLLCLTGLLPFDLWRFSYTLASVGSLFVLFPLLSRVLLKGEKSKPAAGSEKNGRITIALSIIFFFGWTVTIIACLVYPL